MTAVCPQVLGYTAWDGSCVAGSFKIFHSFNLSYFIATCSTLCTEVCVHVSNSIAVDQEWTYGLPVHVQVHVHVCVPPRLLV